MVPSDSIIYLSPEDILMIHQEIIEEDENADAGVQREGDVDFAVNYIKEGSFGEVPEGVHEKAAEQMRLLVGNHPFVDGNKRTALATTNAFYFMNGYWFDYDRRIKELLKELAIDANSYERAEIVEWLEELTWEMDDWEQIIYFAVLFLDVYEEEIEELLSRNSNFTRQDRSKFYRSDGGNRYNTVGDELKNKMATEEKPNLKEREDYEDILRFITRFDMVRNKEVYEDLKDE